MVGVCVCVRERFDGECMHARTTNLRAVKTFSNLSQQSNLSSDVNAGGRNRHGGSTQVWSISNGDAVKYIQRPKLMVNAHGQTLRVHGQIFGVWSKVRVKGHVGKVAQCVCVRARDVCLSVCARACVYVSPC